MMTIGEIAEKTALPESTLRYYERRGLLQVARDSGGRRDYAELDIAWIQFIQRLKETGMSIAGIRRYAVLRPLWRRNHAGAACDFAVAP